MSVLSILTWENPRLRMKSIKVKRIDATIQRLIEDMIETLRDNDGQGLAAPQVGVLLRLIICEYVDDETEELEQLILVNPEIIAKEGEWMAEEGCLSIPGYWGTVTRAVSVTVRGKDRYGHTVKLKSDGRMAHVLQHEIDHLDGVLYVDYLKSIDDLEKVDEGKPRKHKRRSDTRKKAGDALAEGAQPGPELESSAAASGAAPTGTTRSRSSQTQCPESGTPFCACGRRPAGASSHWNYV